MNGLDYSIHYRRFHEDSEEHAEKTANWHANELKDHLPTDLKSPILDIGCGYGYALRGLRNLGYSNLTGIDMSHQQVEKSRKAGFNVIHTENSIKWLNEHPGKFEFIVLQDVLEHVPVPNQIEFSRAINNALRPDGKVFVTVPNANSIIASRWRYIDYTHNSSFTEHSLYFVLKNAGFEKIKLSTEKGIGRFPRRLWRRDARQQARKWIVRWCWWQVFQSELWFEEDKLKDICFELNLKAVATKT